MDVTHICRPLFRARRRKRAGTIIVLMAALLVVIVAILALTIDIGYMTNARAQLQVSVDSGALAGAGVLGVNRKMTRRTVVDYVQRNKVGGHSVATNDIRVELGNWDPVARVFNAGAQSPTAVRVVAHDDSQPMFFGRALNRDTFAVKAEAVAVFQPRDVMLTLDFSSSMNDDSQLDSIGVLGRAAVEQNLAQIYKELGSPGFGVMAWEPKYIASGSVDAVLAELGLDKVPYPFPAGGWKEYVQYMQSDRSVASAGYAKKYGYMTLANYWLDRRPQAHETPVLWKTSEQPVSAVKQSVRVFLSYIQQVKADDRVGLAIYTHPNGGAKLESRLTRQYNRVKYVAAHRQAGHYKHGTNISAGLRVARQELESNAREGSMRMIVLMTDGLANEPAGNAVQLVRDEAQLAAQLGFRIMTISLGAGADTQLMQEVADVTRGKHFHIPGGQTPKEYQKQLKDAFRQIAAARALRLVD